MVGILLCWPAPVCQSWRGPTLLSSGQMNCFFCFWYVQLISSQSQAHGCSPPHIWWIWCSLTGFNKWIKEGINRILETSLHFNQMYSTGVAHTGHIKAIFNLIKTNKISIEWGKEILRLESFSLTWCSEILFSTLKRTEFQGNCWILGIFWHENCRNDYLPGALIQNYPSVQAFRPPIGRTLCSTSPLPHQLTSPLCFPSHIAPTSTPPRGPAQEESNPL